MAYFVKSPDFRPTSLRGLRSGDKDQYQVQIHPDHSHGPAAHGGFVIALLWKSACTYFQTTLAAHGQHDQVAVHVEFLRPPTVGHATVQVKDAAKSVQLRTSRVTIPTGFKIDPPIPPGNFKDALAHKDPILVLFHVPYREYAINKALSTVHILIQRRACEDKSIMQGWVSRSATEEKWTNEELGIFSIQSIANRAVEVADRGESKKHWQWGGDRWYTTVNMTIDVKQAVPPEGVKWLFTRQKTIDVIDGRLSVRGEVWDEQESLVALVQSSWLMVENSRAVISKARKENVASNSKI
ncbi:hypothetical protein LTR37_011754 [Vermiconidia calcicola]|uniref:Uncharacterized protein n=1 Tax=Vermiconidia calcicola TaxID=1690605 RepID=A0ACC3N3W5_9PEZI|nr:hypothetical protein LTR37_011754 [Vermiconidia calcicola]